MEFKTEEGTKRVCKTFGIDFDTLDKRDFQFYLADIFTTGIQYGKRVEMCNDLFDASESVQSLLEETVKFGNANGVTYDGYWNVNLQKTEIDVNSPAR